MGYSDEKIIALCRQMLKEGGTCSKSMTRYVIEFIACCLANKLCKLLGAAGFKDPPLPSSALSMPLCSSLQAGYWFACFGNGS